MSTWIPPTDNRPVLTVPQVTVLALLVLFLVGAAYQGWREALTVTPLVLVAALVYGASLFLLTSFRNLFLDFFVGLSVLFFLQRVILLVLGLTEFQWSRAVPLTSGTSLETLLFLTAVNGAVLAGYLAFRLLYAVRKPSDAGTRPPRLLGPGSFDRSFQVFALLATPLVLLNIYLRGVQGVGVAGVQYNTSLYGPILRLSTLSHTLLFLPWLAILSDHASTRSKQIGVVLVLLYVVSFLTQASRAALVTPLILPAAFAFVYLDVQIRRVHVLGGILVLALIALSWGPITALRPAMEGGGDPGLGTVAGVLVDELGPPEGGFLGVANRISTRFGGFDRLAGILHAGRAPIAPHVGPTYDFANFVNSFVPGQFRTFPQSTHFSKLLPTVLTPREEVGGYGINPTLPGRYYVYFGHGGALAVAGVWSFLSTWFLSRRFPVAVHILFLLSVGINVFKGSVVTPAVTFLEGLLMLGLVYLGTQVLERLVRDRGAVSMVRD